MRPPPSHVGYSTSGMAASGVTAGIDGMAVSSSVTKTGPSWPATWESAQPAGGVPGKAVSRQHIVRSRVKPKRPTAPATTSVQNTRARSGNQLTLDSDMLRASGISPFTVLTIVSLFRQDVTADFRSLRSSRCPFSCDEYGVTGGLPSALSAKCQVARFQITYNLRSTQNCQGANLWNHFAKP